MLIYNKDGEVLTSAFSINSTPLTVAYNVEGEPIWSNNTEPLKVMSYNVGGWYIGSGANIPSAYDGLYYALHRGIIEQNDPDILVIQEYWDIFSKTGRTALSMLSEYFPYIEARNGTDSYMGRCICSKYPISNYTQRSFKNESIRYYDSCTITINDKPITFVNTHFGLTNEKRTEQAKELLAYLKTLDRFIACGDYNTVEALNDTGEDYVSIIQPMLDARFHVANCSTFGFLETYVGDVNKESAIENGKQILCLDNIITSKNIGILSVEVDETKLTDNINALVDHLPIMANLII